MRLSLLACAVAGALLVVPGPARAQEGTGPPGSTVPSAVAIDAGFEFTSAEITAPGTTPRHFDAYKAAVFVQSFIVEAIYGKPVHERPPPGARVYRVDVTGTWNGAPELSTRAIFYASDGKRAFIAAPTPEQTPATGVPAGLDWFVAPARTIDAFAGTAELVPTLGTSTDTTAASTVPPTPAKNASGGSSAPWIVVVLALLAIAGVLVVVLRRRARQPAA